MEISINTKGTIASKFETEISKPERFTLILILIFLQKIFDN